MADGEDVKSPQSINSEESDDMKTVTVKMVIPNMAIEKKFFGKAKPKTGEAEVDIKFGEMSLEVTALVGKGAKKTKYYHKVNQLPGAIDKEACKIEYKKELIILTLVKQEDSTWAVMLSKNGLDQAAD